MSWPVRHHQGSPSPFSASTDGREWSSLLANGDAWLIPLILVFLAKQILFIFLLGPFSGHDEVDHFAYIQRLADGHGLGIVGVVELPSWAQPYDAYVADYPLNAEVIQPPLYHGMLALLLAILPEHVYLQLIVLRSLSAAAGVLVVLLAYATARRVFPHDSAIIILTTTVVAFHPQVSFEAAIVNHDIVVIALASATVYLLVDAIAGEWSWWRCIALAAISVAGLWTKLSFGLFLPIIGFGLTLAILNERQSWVGNRRLGFQIGMGKMVSGSIATIVIPIFTLTPWLMRNHRLYGDLTGTSRLAEISDYGESASTVQEMITSAAFWRGRFEDFWGNYGWRHIPWDYGEYVFTALVCAAAGIGFASLLVRSSLDRFRRKPRPVMDRVQVQVIVLMAATAAMMLAGVLYVGTLQFTQSRFAFPGIVPFSLMAALGLAAWVPRTGRLWLAVSVIIVSLAMTVWVTLRFVIPYYTGGGTVAVSVSQ